MFSFRVGINEVDDFFDMTFDADVESGYKTIIKVYPSVVKMDNNLKAKLPLEKRKCRFADEIPPNMTMFTRYSTSACKFDCMVKYR